MPDARAAYLDRFFSPFLVEDVRLADPAPSQILVRTTAAPFCSTDWMGWRAMRPKVLPVVLGHTAVGRVEAVGSGITDFAPGDRILVAGTPQCGECFYCGIGRPDQCAVLTEEPDPVVGEVGDGRELRAAGHVGSYSEFMLVDRNQVHHLDTDLPDEVAGMLGCGISSALGAVFTIADVQPGQSVAIVGLGHIGLWAVQGARLAGAGRIIGLDYVPGRRDLALSMGATDVIDPAVADPIQAVRDLTDGRGADVVIEAAGPEMAGRQAVMMARRAGTVVLAGVAHSTSDVALPQTNLTIQGKKIVGCQNGQITPDVDFPRWIAMLEDGRLDPSAFVTAEYRLDQIDEARDASMELRDITGMFTTFR